MKFSIIVPIYKVEAYLRECVDSILEQSYKDFELILVDDGSPDGCPQLCDEYAANDNRVKVIHKKNGGLVSARIAGCKAAKGEYIIGVDGDDWIAYNLLEKVADVISRYNPDMIHWQCYVVGNNKMNKQTEHISEGYYDKKGLQNIIHPLILTAKNNFFSHTIWLNAFRRRLYIDNQLNAPNIRLGEDAVVVFPIVFQIASYYQMNEYMYYYRYNDKSMTKSRIDGFSWEDWEKSFDYLISLKCMQNDERKQMIYKYTAHNLFVTALSHFQVKGKKYKDVREEILKNYSRQYAIESQTNAHFKFGTLDYFAGVLMKHRFIAVTYLLSLFYKN